MSSNVQVAVRARPLNTREIDLKSPVVVEMRDKATTLFKTVDGVAIGETRDDSKEFKYDHSFWSVDKQDLHFVTQEQVYSSLGKSVLESAFQGFNACVFAYGQTGSGKTYTMMGSEGSPGLIPRICQNLFARTAAGSLRKVSYRVEASYMEIYNEKVHDLLQSKSSVSSPQHNLKVREHPKEGPYVEGLSRHLVADYESIEALMKRGNSHRATAATKMNDVSSRSHAIFTLIFTQAVYSVDLPCETVSKIHLVDLAGSERVASTGAEGARLKEGGNINRSLACLGNVISALADMSSGPSRQKKHYHIPYRDSVLTWLLKDSLGGNSKTIMIATISPAEVCYGETLSTLRYASRAKNILNKPVVNEDPNVRLIRELRAEIKRLKTIIAGGNYEDTRERSGSHLLAEQLQNIHKKEEQIAELTKSWAGKWTGMSQQLEESNLELHTEGIKMTVATEKPHFLALDDLSATGVVLYQLQDGDTTIGSNECSSSRDIVLSGEGIQPRHCVVSCSQERVELIRQDGYCSVNTQEVEDKRLLIHGDFVQFGQSIVFRFNNISQAPAAAEDTNKSTLLNLSNFSKESERERLEREYSERLTALKEELIRQSEEEKAALYQQLEELRQQAASRNSESSSNFSITESDAYNVMQSVAGLDIKQRVVEGEEQRDVLSLQQDDSEEDEEVFENGGTSTPIVGKGRSKSDSDSEASFIDTFINIHSEAEKSNGLPEESLYSLNISSSGDIIKHTESPPLSDRNGATAAEPFSPQLTNGHVLGLEGSGEEVDFFDDDIEKDNLRRKVDELEGELRKKELELNDKQMRRRSHAFGEFDSPIQTNRFKRRSNSTRSLKSSVSTALIIDIPDVVLRGSGFSSYHVYVVVIELNKDKWKIYKSYSQFSHLHETLKSRYPQLSSLTLPPSKWFGVKKPAFVQQRQKDLKVYLQSLLAICMNLAECPLYDPVGRRLSRKRLIKLSTFFDGGAQQT